MPILPSLDIMCPYCGEQLEVLVDGSVARQEYIEDCQVCCRPMVLRVEVAHDGTITIDARTEDD